MCVCIHTNTPTYHTHTNTVGNVRQCEHALAEMEVGVKGLIEIGV